MFFRLLSFVFIVFFLPVLIFLNILIYLYDFNNPIYAGKRVGLNNKIFYQYKFRSMKKKNIDQGDVTSTSNNDPRITFIGHFIRKTKIDEIPQLLNVIFGDMSIVGPRPQVPKAVEDYTIKERFLLSVKPGITDFASIVFSDEGDILLNSKNPDLDYDLYIRFWKNYLGLIYLNHRTFLLDTYIILLTVINFIHRRTALRLISNQIYKFSINYLELSKVCLRDEKLKKIKFSDDDFKLY